MHGLGRDHLADVITMPNHYNVTFVYDRHVIITCAYGEDAEDATNTALCILTEDIGPAVNNYEQTYAELTDECTIGD